MNDINKLAKAIGVDRISTALRIGKATISTAVVSGKFPSAWYPTIKRLAFDADIDVSSTLFNWRRPEDAHFIDDANSESDEKRMCDKRI